MVFTCLVPFPAPRLGPWFPPHNEQLVESLHFMEIGWKDKGVSLLCCPVLPPWPMWEGSPSLRPIFGSGDRGSPYLPGPWGGM